MSRDHQKLRVFHAARALAVDVYRITADFPPEEKYGMQSQLRRAATSISTNIVEGCARENRAEYANFLNIAMGSASETLHLLTLARDVGLLDDPDLIERSEEVVKGLCKLQQRVRAPLTNEAVKP